MRKDNKKIFTHFKPAAPDAGLFDRIIFAIRQEQELQNKKRLLFVFFGLLLVSLAAAPFSWTILAKQMESSGMIYFISAAVNDFGAFLALWQSFGLAILESLPIVGLIAFVINMALALFTLRLFLRKKQFLLKYLTQNFNHNYI